VLHRLGGTERQKKKEVYQEGKFPGGEESPLNAFPFHGTGQQGKRQGGRGNWPRDCQQLYQHSAGLDRMRPKILRETTVRALSIHSEKGKPGLGSSRGKEADK